VGVLGDAVGTGQFSRSEDARRALYRYAASVGSMSWEVGPPDGPAHPAADDGDLEPCECCGRETPHEVHIEIRTESAKRENAQYSREPYRVATCVLCGEESATRMNNA
jgi:hypothetical protein